jgi:plastocyanin
MAATLYHESDGKAVNVDLTATVIHNQVAYAQGWLGITNEAAESGDTIALTVDEREYQWPVPDALTVNKGDTVYVDVTNLTGHTPDSDAYYTAAGSNRIKLFKATAAKDTSRGAGNHFVTGKSLLPVQSL